MEQYLESQANQIEWVLRSHRVPVRVLGGTVTPRWIHFQILPELTTKVSRITALSEEIALHLGAASVRIARQGARVEIEVPRLNPQKVNLMALLPKLGDMPRQSAVLGLDNGGRPLILRLASPEVAHVLIAGTTGSGKTALARSMALSLAMSNRLGEIQLLFIDPKRNGFEPFARTHQEQWLPHLLRPVIDDVHQAIFTLGEMVSEMVRRDQQRITDPRLIIFIDEVADLMEQGGKAMDRLMTRLTQRGRSAGIHLIACTQKPLAATIGSLTRSNFPVRIIGSVTSPDDARIAAGIPSTGAEKLLGRGDFLLVVKSQVTRFQGAYVSEAEIRQVVERLQAKQRHQRQWLELSPPEEVQPLAATGTDDLVPARPVVAPQRGIKAVLGHQLRLLK
ncbi:MAG: DNA translocase FtsK [Anaerolineae bacterium]|nr:DNA translocase FtsK [Anaerolineae bacterium]